MYNMFGRNYNELSFVDVVYLGDRVDYCACVNEIDRFYKSHENYEKDGDYINLMDKQKIDFLCDYSNNGANKINYVYEADELIEIGIRYYEGQGVEKDYNKAFKYFDIVNKWIEDNEKEGKITADYLMKINNDINFNRLKLYLAKCYFNGHGVEKDVMKGFKFFDDFLIDENTKNLFYINLISDLLGFRGVKNLKDVCDDTKEFVKMDYRANQYAPFDGLYNNSLYNIALGDMYTYGLFGNVNHKYSIYNYFRGICFINRYINYTLYINYFEHYKKEELKDYEEGEEDLHNILNKILKMENKIYNELGEITNNKKELYNLDLVKNFNKDVLLMDIDEVIELANEGDATAMVKASYCYQLGGFVEEDEKEWLKYTTMAANKNSLDCMIQLADNFIKYNEVNKGIDLYKKVMALTMKKSVDLLISDFKGKGLKNEKRYINNLNDYIKKFEKCISYKID